MRVVKREKRGSHCLPEQGVVTAPAPVRIVPKGKLSNEFIIKALATKYQQHLPVYRQWAVLMDNHSIEVDRTTLTSAILVSGELLVAVVQAQELMRGTYLQADEMTPPVQTRAGKGRNHRACVWQYSAPGGPVVFDFQMGRGREGPKTFLQGFRGKLQCDGYSGYDDLGEGIVYVGCMAHVRRGFVEAANLAPLDPLPKEIVGIIARLYAVEKTARESNLDAAVRLALPKAKVVRSGVS